MIRYVVRTRFCGRVFVGFYKCAGALSGNPCRFVHLPSTRTSNISEFLASHKLPVALTEIGLRGMSQDSDPLSSLPLLLAPEVGGMILVRVLRMPFSIICVLVRVWAVCRL
jgi:hypothetical protein